MMSTLSMEALSSSSFIPKLSISSSSEHSIATGCCLTGRGVSEFNLSISYTPRSRRVFALAHGDNEHDNQLIGGNGSILFPQESISFPQILKMLALSFKHVVDVVFGTQNFVPKGSFDQEQPSEKDAATTSDVVLPHAHGGTRAGLFRTPISGGVQSATSAHGLPRPSLAVRNLMEQARFAHLCTTMYRIHHRRDGYPFGSLVDFAPDSLGHPIFSFSPLAIHTRNVIADPRCTLVVQIPGWSGLSNARVTIFGDVVPLPNEYQEWAHKQYIAKHQQAPSQQWGDFHYFRMENIGDIHFIGGFGTVAWIDVKEYETVQPDKIAVNGGEQNLKELNAIFSKPLKELLSQEGEVDDAALISIDSKGTDIRVRQGAQFNMQRISFEEGYAVETLEQAKSALRKLINRGRVHNLRL